MINWFFIRLETSYGRKFWTEFSDEKTVQLTKREWGKGIVRYSKEELHFAIEYAKEQREKGNEDFEWPDIAKILGLLKRQISPNGGNSEAYLQLSDPNHSCYREPAIEDQAQKEKDRAARNMAMTEMRGLF